MANSPARPKLPWKWGWLHRSRMLLWPWWTWTDADGAKVRNREPWSLRWAFAGIHSYKWFWVRRWGRMECGCTRNPLTRRTVLFKYRCPAGHCGEEAED